MHVYLSPHLDDAALSCGGLIHKQRRRGEAVLVITVGTAAPDPAQPLSPLAQEIHQRMGDPSDLVVVRCAEDEAAMRRLGAEYIHLGWHDAIYRGRPGEHVWFYPTMPDLFGGVLHGEEQRAPDVLAALVQNSVEDPPTRVYGPLSVGGHVDHVLAHLAVWSLRMLGWSIAFYEDVPYAEPGFPHPLDEGNESSIESVVAAVDASVLEPEMHALREEDLVARIESVQAYTSQIPMLYGSDEEAERRIRAFAGRFGRDEPAERLWVPV